MRFSARWRCWSIQFRSRSSRPEHGEAGVFAHYFDWRQTDTSSSALAADFPSVPAATSSGKRNGLRLRPHLHELTPRKQRARIRAHRRAHARRPNRSQIPNPRQGSAVCDRKGRHHPLRSQQQPASISGFTSEVSNLRSSNVNPALYPGGGIEGFFGPWATPGCGRRNLFRQRHSP